MRGLESLPGRAPWISFFRLPNFSGPCPRKVHLPVNSRLSRATQPKYSHILNGFRDVLPIQYEPFKFIGPLVLSIIYAPMPSIADTFPLRIETVQKYPVGLILNHQKEG